MYHPRIVHVRPELDRMAEYIPGESLEAFSLRTGIPIERLIKLNSNENPYGPGPAVLKALGDHNKYNNYPDVDSTALRTALSAYTGLDSRFIVLSHGSNELINLLWHIFLSVGDNIICCTPTFSLYTFVTTFCGAYVLEVPRTADYEVDIDAIMAALTPETKLITLCSPNNPTGNPVSETDVLALLDTGRIVVVDEAYVEFSHQPGGLADLVPHYRNLVILRTFSKWAGLAGLRIGYGLLPEWMVRYVRRIIEERERLFNMLAAQPYLEPVPSQGNFILAHVSEDLKVEHIRAAVESHGVLLRYFHHPYLSDFVRVTVGRPEHTDVLATALAQVMAGATANYHLLDQSSVPLERKRE